MSNRKFSFVPGEFFHIYNRGNSKQQIFLDRYDYERFLNLLYTANSSKAFKLYFIKDPYEFERGEGLVSIGSYCLMPNHFHILLSPLNDNGVSEFMRKIMTGYTMYFNNKYKRTGSLFEGKFKAELVSNDEYLKYLFSYIHLNPVKLIQSDWKENGIKDYNEAYKYACRYMYSSLGYYLDEPRKENKILNSSVFPDYFPSKEGKEQELLEWLNFNEN